jgi:hypothetical protein
MTLLIPVLAFLLGNNCRVWLFVMAKFVRGKRALIKNFCRHDSIFYPNPLPGPADGFLVM